jgi:hypothetical protein
VSYALEDPRGYYVIKIDSVREEHILPLEKVKKQIERILQEEHYKSLAFEKISGIYRQIQNGKSFEDAAKDADIPVEFTEEFGPRDRIDGIGREPKFSGRILILNEGDVSSPIEGERGYYLMKVLEKEEPDLEISQEEQGEIMQRLFNEKQQLYSYAWISELREKADIKDYRDEYFSQ